MIDTVFEHALDGVVAVDDSLMIVGWNPAAERMVGYTRAEVIGRRVDDVLVLPAEREGFHDWVARTLTAATPGSKMPVELPVQHSDGGTRQLELLATNLLDDPDVRAIVINVRDVTDRRCAEEALRASAERMAALLQQLRRGIVLLSEDHLVVLANQTFCDLFSIHDSPESLVGIPGRELAERIVPLIDDPDFFETTREAIFERKGFNDLLTFLEDGRILERTMVIIEADHGSLGSLWLYEDVTDQAIVAQTLADQNAQLQKLDQMRADWLATASHELKTPITAIAGAAELLGTDATDETRALTEVISRNTERISKIIDAMLTISELDHDRPALALAPVDVPALCRRAVETVSLDGRASAISIALSTDSGPPVMGDGERMGQLVDNLVTNAVKFTPAGGHVSVTAHATTSGWTIEVCDDGIGIPADELDTLFLRFRRASNARDLQIPGSGLGLTIAKVVADLHSAVIGVDSIEGEGTTVRVCIPTNPEAGQGTDS